MHAVTIVDGALEWRRAPRSRAGARRGPGVGGRPPGSTPPTSCSDRGLYPAPPGYPADIPGMELAGEVVGAGRRDEPVGRSGTGSCPSPAAGPRRSWRSSRRAPPWRCPTASPGTRPAGSPRSSAPPTTRSFTQARLAAGERVLISGAAGGVGSAAVQLAHAAGAHVVASVRSLSAPSPCPDLGADEVIEPDQVPDHGPYDVSLELVGAPRGRRRAARPGHGRAGGGHRCRAPGPRSSSTSWP